MDLSAAEQRLRQFKNDSLLVRSDIANSAIYRRGCRFLTHWAIPIVLITTYFVASSTVGVIGTVPNTALNQTCLDLNIYSSVSKSWKVWIAITPFIMVVYGILCLNLSSSKVAPSVLLVTCVLGFLYFSEDGVSKNQDLVTTVGIIVLIIADRFVWTVVDYVYNVFAAFVFLRVMQLWGIVPSLREEFTKLADSPERKIVLILFCFAIMMAIVAPGGSNFLIAGSIALQMNIMNAKTTEERNKYDLRIGGLVLFGNALASAFNLVGVCIIALVGDVLPLIDAAGVNAPCQVKDELCAQKQVGLHFSAQFFVFSLFAPTLMVFLVTRNVFTMRFLKREFPLLFGCGFFYSLAQVITAGYIGPQLPCLTSAGSAMLFYFAYVFQFEKRFLLTNATSGELANQSLVDLDGIKLENTLHQVDDDDGEKQQQPPPSQAAEKPLRERLSILFPFVVLIVLLLLTNVVDEIKWSFTGGDDASAQQALDVILLTVQTTCVKLSRRFDWFISSGTMVMYAALLTPFLTKFRAEADTEKALLKMTYINLGQMRQEELRHLVDFSAEDFNSDEEDDDDTVTVAASDKKATFWHMDKVKHMTRGLRKLTTRLTERDATFWSRYRFVMATAVKDGLKESFPVIFGIGGFSSLARVMSNFGMTDAIANALVESFSSRVTSWGFVAPILGMLGSILTGSTTTSNFLFARLQVKTALNLGIVTPTNSGSIWAVLASQILGASAGELASPQNAIFSVILLRGRATDAQVIKQLLPFTFACWLFVCCIVGLIAIGNINYTK